MVAYNTPPGTVLIAPISRGSGTVLVAVPDTKVSYMFASPAGRQFQQTVRTGMDVATPSTGQLWPRSTSSTTGAPTITVGNTPPPAPSVNDVWIDTT